MMINELTYVEAIRNSSEYNKSLVVDRKTRLPYIDSQTGVAQRDSSLWMQKWQRMPGNDAAKIYSYPAKKWRIKRRQYLLNDNLLLPRGFRLDGGETVLMPVPEVKKSESDFFIEKSNDFSRDSFIYHDFDDSFDGFVEADFEEHDTENDEFEDPVERRRRKRPEAATRRRAERNEANKPFVCDSCDMRYKTLSGLQMHQRQVHNKEVDKNFPVNQDDDRFSPLKPQTALSKDSSVQITPVDSDKMPIMSKLQEQLMAGPNSAKLGIHVENDSKEPQAVVQPNSYCDFCIGNEEETKKHRAEKLISCSDCGRSAHPSCLKFTPNMIFSVTKYRWQCLECKSCGVCGTSDNDEQLLFCDDCDRGYHMFCLTPPISEPPEGLWSCHLCIKEYHTPKEEKLNEERKTQKKEEGTELKPVTTISKISDKNDTV